MLIKLVMVIVVVGATASALLVNRQKRIETFHEMSLIHHRLLQQEETLWKMRGQIAEHCRPSEVRAAVTTLGGEWMPIPAKPIGADAMGVTASMRVVHADGTDVKAASPSPAKSKPVQKTATKNRTKNTTSRTGRSTQTSSSTSQSRTRRGH